MCSQGIAQSEILGEYNHVLFCQKIIKINRYTEFSMYVKFFSEFMQAKIEERYILSYSKQKKEWIQYFIHSHWLCEYLKANRNWWPISQFIQNKLAKAIHWWAIHIEVFSYIISHDTNKI